VTVRKLNLGPDGRTTYQLPYYGPEDEGPNPARPVHFDIKVVYTNTLGVQELLDYLSSADGNTRYEEKEAVLQALNLIVTRKAAATPGIASFMRANKFFPTGHPMDLGRGLVALQGCYTSVRTATLRLLVNVNAVTAAFYKAGSLADLMAEHKSGAKVGWEGPMNRFLKGVRVELTHITTKSGAPKVKTILGLSRNPPGAGANVKKFIWEERSADKPKELTVQEYYWERMCISPSPHPHVSHSPQPNHRSSSAYPHTARSLSLPPETSMCSCTDFRVGYQIQLTKPYLPVVNVGSAAREIWIPAELCNVVPGQPANDLLSPDQTSQMIRVAARRPADNARYIVGNGATLMGLGDPGPPDGAVSRPLSSFSGRYTGRGFLLCSLPGQC
jgi:hypothetical protein